MHMKHLLRYPEDSSSFPASTFWAGLIHQQHQTMLIPVLFNFVMHKTSSLHYANVRLSTKAVEFEVRQDTLCVQWKFREVCPVHSGIYLSQCDITYFSIRVFTKHFLVFCKYHGPNFQANRVYYARDYIRISVFQFRVPEPNCVYIAWKPISNPSVPVVSKQTLKAQ
jgi:hypothetical protein